MSEYYDHYHRWEPLAEFHFSLDSDDDFDDDNYLYCLCSRVFIRDSVRTYYVEKEVASESETEVLLDSQSQDGEDHSHVHFSLDTSYKVKCEKDESASCYCSASHTENCCSTDEHDPAQIHNAPHALQPSDSGADLTYQDYHSEYIAHDKLENMDENNDFFTETDNYLSENTWDKFWAVHGERLIWASWIKKYSSYINPAYLNENNDLLIDENGVPKQQTPEENGKDKVENDDDGIRERKFSYDSKVNPYKKNSVCEKESEKIDAVKDDQWLPVTRQRSFSEHDRILSPKTVTGTDSMTNVTKMTLSSYDIGSSQVTSESTPTEDYSMSSSSEDHSNDQTRISNVNECLDNVPVDEMDTEQYWQFLWKQHFGEQYAVHYANYINIHSEQRDVPTINIDTAKEPKQKEKTLDIGSEYSEGNSQETPTVIEVQNKVEQMKLDDKPKTKKRNKKKSFRYLDSVGVLLKNLIKDEEIKTECVNEDSEVMEAGDEKEKKSEPIESNTVDEINVSSYQQSNSNTSFKSYSYDDGDDDPPEEIPIELKRSHEYDEEESAAEKIKSTFEIMGFCVKGDDMLKGNLIYRKRLARLRPPKNKKYGSGRKTYFDEDGNAFHLNEYEKQMQSIEENVQKMSDVERKSDVDPSEAIERKDEKDKCTENIEGQVDETKVEDRTIDIPLDIDIDKKDTIVMPQAELMENISVPEQETTKRRKRPKRYSREEDSSEIPQELQDDPKMRKYWRKRHSLFHRFDEGIQLDRESWFSVTPENVARHIATKCPYDVIVDAFCGAGGNTIQFAKTSKKVIAIDIDPVKIEMAKHNAQVYGVLDRIEFIVGDFFELAPQLTADMVFLSPPWGGPNYSSNREYDLETMLAPKPASELMSVARTVSSCIALYLPRNSRPDQILALAKNVHGSVEIEQSYLDRKFVAITAYYY